MCFVQLRDPRQGKYPNSCNTNPRFVHNQKLGNKRFTTHDIDNKSFPSKAVRCVEGSVRIHVTQFEAKPHQLGGLLTPPFGLYHLSSRLTSDPSAFILRSLDEPEA